MSAISSLISLLLALCGLAAFVAGLGLAAAPDLASDTVDAVSTRSVDAIDDTTTSALQLEAALSAVVTAVPEAGKALFDAAEITEQVAVTLRSTEKAGRSLAQGLNGLSRQVRGLLGPGKIKDATTRLRIGLNRTDEALENAEVLAKQLPPLANQLRALSRSVTQAGEQLKPAVDALPKVRDRLTRARAAIQPEQFKLHLAWVLRGFGGLLALLGIALLSVASTRLRLERALKEIRG
jgi:hypothetical protein